MQSPDLVPIRRALISVSDKTGVIEFARTLVDNGVEILSTGGTAQALMDSGILVKEVSNHTGFPEMMGGRIKTLHPTIHGGILSLRNNPDHRDAMAQHKISAIDLVVINLYPFEETVLQGGDFSECIENIDIGGPAIIRSAAKNHAFVVVATEVSHYTEIANEMAANKTCTGIKLRKRLAATAYSLTGAYDAAISNWFHNDLAEHFPEKLLISGKRVGMLRYGENPHQKGAFYAGGFLRPGVSNAKQIQGKVLSYNNINDTDAAYELVSEFAPGENAAVAIIKHANPCGVAIGSNLLEAYEKALKCDPVSAFGGIIATNRPLDASIAEAITKIFTEVIISPGANDAAKAIIAKKSNLRLLLADKIADPTQQGYIVRNVAEGYLVQSRDAGQITSRNIDIVTKRQPSEQEQDDLLFAYRVCKHVKSNAIVYAKNGATVGIGAGQMSRLDAARIATQKAAEAAEVAKEMTPRTVGSVAASDAFFPFADGLLAVANAGATAVIQPGGSMRDSEIINAADEVGISMGLTGMRHFRH